MNKIRVLLANHPFMIPLPLREMLSQQQDMELVGEICGPMKILQETGRTMADAVVLAQEGSGEPGLNSQLLAVYPDLTILSVNVNMESAYTQQLCSRRRELGQLEMQDLPQTLRAAVWNPWHSETSGSCE